MDRLVLTNSEAAEIIGIIIQSYEHIYMYIIHIISMHVHIIIMLT